MNDKNLREKTLTGFKWSFLDNVGKYGGQFIVGIILTRLLTPEDFGLVGMITIFIVIGQSLTNSGFGQALIQKKNATNIDFSTVFYFNILASILIYSVIYFSAPLIANFYDQPQLILLTQIICLSFVIESFGRTHSTHLEKQLNFKAPAIIGLTSVILAGIVSITMAYTGYGVWALVTQVVLKSIITTILFWWASKWRPLLVFSKKSLKSLFMFGSKILVAGLMHSIFQNIYYLIIGRFFSAQTLGYYTRAKTFAEMPVNTITVIIQKVTFPVFSTIQDDDEKLKSGYTKAIRTLSAVVLPLMGIIIIASKPLINIVLGEKWLPVVPYLIVMATYGWMHIIYVMNHQIITVKGRSDYYLQIKIIDKILIIISILITYRYGVMAMIYGHMIATILSYGIGNIYFKKVIDISLMYQVKNVIPFLISATLLVISGFIVSRLIINEFIYLFVSIPLGILIYIAVLRVMKVDELRFGISLVRNAIVKYRG
jgi:teichuronic acid exporter